MFMMSLFVIGFLGLSKVRSENLGEVENLDSHEEHIEEPGVIHLNEAALQEAQIEIEAIGLRSISACVDMPGTVTPHPESEGFIGSMVEGRVKQLDADLGDQVTIGQPLCIIESPVIGEAAAAYLTALADMEYVQKDRDRHQTLMDEGIGSIKELQELEAGLVSVKTRVDATERTLHAIGFSEEDIQSVKDGQHTGGRVVLRSPANGDVVMRQARIGMQVNTELDLFHVIDLNRLRVEIDIPEQYIHEIKPNLDITIVTQNGQVKEIQGSIERVAGKVDPETRTFTAYATILNSERILFPGAFVTIRFNIANGGTKVLALPSKAIFKDEHGDFAVFVEMEPGEFALCEVNTGSTTNGWVEITEGLSLGDRVVTQGAFAIKSESLKGQFGDGHGH